MIRTGPLINCWISFNLIFTSYQALSLLTAVAVAGIIVRFIKGYTGHPHLGGVATRVCITPQRKGVREAVCDGLWVLRRKPRQTQ